MPKVSVIIPVYNTEKYLRECLDSVISQTLDDIEIICINDGSTDNSLEILREYAQKDTRIVIIDQKNKGVSTARNNGIKLATGEFVCFMDPDDKYPTNDVLEALYNGAKENNVLICGGEFAFFTSENPNLTQDFLEVDNKYIFEKDEIIEYKNYQFDYGYTRFLYNREFLLSRGLIFPNYRRFQDPPFFVQAMIMAGKFYALKRITYAYRHEHKTIKWDKRKTFDMLSGARDNMKLAKKYNLDQLNKYSFERFKQHYFFFNEFIGFKSYLVIKEMEKYNHDIKIFRKDYRLTFCRKYISGILRNVFSIRNSADKRHKVLTVLGIKIKIKRNK